MPVFMYLHIRCKLGTEQIIHRVTVTTQTRVSAMRRSYIKSKLYGVKKVDKPK